MIQARKFGTALGIAGVTAFSLALVLGGVTYMSRAPDVAPEVPAPMAYEVTIQAPAAAPRDVRADKQEKPATGVGEHAGVLGALRDEGAPAGKSVVLQMLGTSGDASANGAAPTVDLLGSGATVAGLDAALEGVSGVQGGVSGLGARGTGLGGGGAVGLGGLGTKGRGGGFASGTSRYAERADLGAHTGAGDQYDAIAENAFTAVANAPLSTLSVDVDTASYANVRRFLEDGQAPPRDAVRIEELLNYFPYDYAPPTNGAPFATHAEVTEAPWAAGHRLVRIGIKGKETPARATPPRNLVFLVDVSGSMNGADRLALVQRGLSLLARQLGPEDHVAMVVYAGAAGVVLEPTRGDRTEAILHAVDSLRAGGSTAGAAGIRRAYALAKENFRKGAINRVILATDGDFNVGVSSEAELLGIIEEERKSGVFLTVLGVGRGNLQDAKMELLADKGNGNYAYIDSFSEMRKVLGDQVGGTLDTIAKDVKIQVEFNPALVSSYRLVGYENRLLAARDFADDTKDAGEIGAGHTVTALYEVVPTGVTADGGVPLRYQERALTDAAGTGELLTVKLRYKARDGDTSELLSFPVRDTGGRFAQASTDTRWAAAVAGYGMLLRDSPHKGTLAWGWVRDTAREALGRDTAGYRAEFLGLVEKARRLGG